MLPLAITLVLIALGTFLIGRYSFRQPASPTPTATDSDTDCASCGLLPTQCHNECDDTDDTTPIDYFDDEELDAYRERPSHAYTDEEADDFAHVLHTMQPEEVPQWLNSLRMRHIQPPDQLKEELVFFLTD